MESKEIKKLTNRIAHRKTLIRKLQAEVKAFEKELNALSPDTDGPFSDMSFPDINFPDMSFDFDNLTDIPDTKKRRGRARTV